MGTTYYNTAGVQDSGGYQYRDTPTFLFALLFSSAIFFCCKLRAQLQTFTWELPKMIAPIWSEMALRYPRAMHLVTFFSCPHRPNVHVHRPQSSIHVLLSGVDSKLSSDISEPVISNNTQLVPASKLVPIGANTPGYQLAILSLQTDLWQRQAGRQQDFGRPIDSCLFYSRSFDSWAICGSVVF